MGSFKDMLESSFEKLYSTESSKTHSHLISQKLKDEFTKMIGEPVIWETKQNTNLKAPQLVVIEKPYAHHVVVKKTSTSIEGLENTIRYSIPYFSLYAGLDKFERLVFR